MGLFMGRMVIHKLGDKNRPDSQIDWKKVDETSEADIAGHEAEDEIAWQDYLKEKNHQDETAAE